MTITGKTIFQIRFFGIRFSRIKLLVTSFDRIRTLIHAIIGEKIKAQRKPDNKMDQIPDKGMLRQILNQMASIMLRKYWIKKTRMRITRFTLKPVQTEFRMIR